MSKDEFLEQYGDVVVRFYEYARYWLKYEADASPLEVTGEAGKFSVYAGEKMKVRDVPGLVSARLNGEEIFSGPN